MHALQLYTSEDVLHYYPYRYEVLISKPKDTWQIKEHVCFEARVCSGVSEWRKGKFLTSKFKVIVEDVIELKITIFNRPWARNIQIGQLLTIQGIYQGNNNVIATTYDTKPLAAHKQITPVYPTKSGIRQNTIQSVMERVFECCGNEIVDFVPEEFRQKYKLLRHHQALQCIHFPKNVNDPSLAQRTLKYEEFLLYFTKIQLHKNMNFTGSYRAPYEFSIDKVNALIKKLPFSLSKDQIGAVNAILEDFTGTTCMHRLVMGDVGCGKTVVASIAMYACILSHKQAALLAPTEILAKQHYETIQNFLPKNVKCALLYSGLSNSQKSEIKADIAKGKYDIIIGTHALLTDDVKFANVGFVIADEQQRFGVGQRQLLKDKGENVDFLLMSATPIPRTLAGVLYGDMDVSIIETMPVGRKVPITKLILENSFRSVLSEIEEILNQGHQIYVICAAVEKNEGYEARNVEDTTKNLAKLFSNYRVGMLHGQMNSIDKQSIMQEFYGNKIQILVSTTVVEVGMNVVNATGMIVYDADRFGLSQLHQLRGRIQRGNDVGRCWLLTNSQEEKVKKRLQVLVDTHNGFEVAYEDLKQRGPGDILGTRQSGLPDFILGNPVQDENILQTAGEDAKHVVAHLDNVNYAALIAIADAHMREEDRKAYEQ